MYIDSKCAWVCANSEHRELVRLLLLLFIIHYERQPRSVQFLKCLAFNFDLDTDSETRALFNGKPHVCASCIDRHSANKCFIYSWVMPSFKCILMNNNNNTKIYSEKASIVRSNRTPNVTIIPRCHRTTPLPPSLSCIVSLPTHEHTVAFLPHSIPSWIKIYLFWNLCSSTLN